MVMTRSAKFGKDIGVILTLVVRASECCLSAGWAHSMIFVILEKSRILRLPNPLDLYKKSTSKNNAGTNRLFVCANHTMEMISLQRIFRQTFNRHRRPNSFGRFRYVLALIEKWLIDSTIRELLNYLIYL